MGIPIRKGRWKTAQNWLCCWEGPGRPLGDPGSFLRLVEAKENFLHIFSVYKAGRFFLAAGGGADLRSASEDRTY